MSSKKITSRDIARNLGISRTVVSMVLNGRSKEFRISADLAKRVLDYAAEHNYEPNHLARSLRTGKTAIIGLIVADISNPFFARLARYIETEASQSEYSVVFCSSEESVEKFDNQLNTLMNRNVDGLILTPPIGSEEILRRLNEEMMPFVVIDRFFEKVPGHYITINNHKSAFDATKLFLDNKCERVALINVNNELFTMNQRTRGYLDAITEFGLEVNPELIKQLKFSHNIEEVAQAVRSVIENKADAILFTTNKLGVCGIQTVQSLGKKIPEEVSIISFDDTEAYTLASTSITAIKQPLEQVSVEAVKLLDHLIETSRANNRIHNVELESELILRESCKLDSSRHP